MKNLLFQGRYLRREYRALARRPGPENHRGWMLETLHQILQPISGRRMNSDPNLARRFGHRNHSENDVHYRHRYLVQQLQCPLHRILCRKRFLRIHPRVGFDLQDLHFRV